MTNEEQIKVIQGVIDAWDDFVYRLEYPQSENLEQMPEAIAALKRLLESLKVESEARNGIDSSLQRLFGLADIVRFKIAEHLKDKK